MSVVAIDRVAKRYGRVTALSDVSMTIADGEFFGLLGPSGGGKTTLLRSIAGFVDPDEGAIAIDGKPIQDVPINRRDIGMMFQNYALFPHLTVADNVGFGLSVRHRPRAEIAARVAELLRLVRLESHGERKPRQLSGGQQQRIALARALATNPKVLLLDEPLGALDKKLREEMQIELKQIQRDVGITTVFVTHDQEEALTLSDRIAIMSEGRVEQIGPPRALYERPRTRFVANFLGNANFFEGRVVGRDGALTRILLDDGSAILTTDAAAEGTRVTAAVRPEKFAVGPDAAADADGLPRNRLAGRVTAEVFTGNAVTYRLDVAGRTVGVFVQNRAGAGPAEGDTLQLSWSPAHTVLVEG
ncbi:ABC transporter ATP-binding protein [Oharaeibacter diazotrophicus]|uniref:Spermidine/putrescine import ATP-binding protein PotA n=1 Tax=Oharaeibacter diazotrophicus TaxID=1920512 RepID=A0A4R6REC9_9HYPH|nr:ABC transporter ATP-binding protein [Oharaeibacter diazotrophicus]TDP84097.1 putative spermidine/putrescine transport system ATP-binding protein [Oharaeibacter diazotrophicus]BBE73136.1 spermidine/putrescine import ATP-binding protein PotA [Pleomorphomonas sp. SM30]GLS74925.1 polyamine-transporting ATPase [Oharaeibacter diazotrophicus]